MSSNLDSGQHIPAFITKLWHMVSDESLDDLICWGPEKTSFIIKDEPRFCSELLPSYYKHNNMSSFIRQLNKYGFHKAFSAESLSLKSALEKSEMEFSHPFFVKDHPYLLNEIKRKTSSTKEMSELKCDKSLITSLFSEIQQLQAKQEIVENKLLVMKNENDVLWREHTILKQKHQKQQQMVNKLIQFLMSLIRGINIRGGFPLMLKDGMIQHVEGRKAIEAKGFPVKKSPSVIGFKNISTFKEPLKISLLEPSSTNTIFPTKRKIDVKVLKEISESKKLKESINTTDEKKIELNTVQSSDTETVPITSPTNSLENLLNEDPLISTGPELNPDIFLTPSEVVSTELNLDPEPNESGAGKTVALCNPSTSGTGDDTNQLDFGPSDFEALKDLLSIDGLSIDASTIMGLFNSKDPISFNMTDGDWNEKTDLDASGSGLVPYSPPNLLDMVNIFDSEETGVNADEPAEMTDSNLYRSELNTPLPVEISDISVPELRNDLETRL